MKMDVTFQRQHLLHPSKDNAPRSAAEMSFATFDPPCLRTAGEVEVAAVFTDRSENTTSHIFLSPWRPVEHS